MLRYTITPSDIAGHRYHVALDIPAPANGEQLVRMPAWIAGSYLLRNFAKNVECLTATQNGKALSARKVDTHSWAIRGYEASQAIRVEIMVYAFDPSVRQAYLDDVRGFFNGTSVFLEVVGQTDQPCMLDIKAPAGFPHWKVYTALPLATGHEGCAERHGFGLYCAPNYDALLDHPVEMGTPVVLSFEAHGALHELIFTGHAPNVDFERMRDDIKRIAEYQIALFEPESKKAPFLDSADRYVFMTLITSGDYGGLEHRASTALVIPRENLPVRGQSELSDEYVGYLGLVSHEYFHTWNVKRMKPAAFVPYRFYEENFTKLLWVFEGFTDYYDDKVIMRCGLIDEARYMKLEEKLLNRVLSTPGRHVMSAADVSFDAWTKFYQQDENSLNSLISYYAKGSLVAWGLDLYIQNETEGKRSLDDVLHLMWARYGRDFYAEGHVQQGFPEGVMPSLILEATGVDVSDFVARYAEGTEDVPFAELLKPHGWTVRTKENAAKAGLSARIRAGARGEAIVAAVPRNGAAHKAGIYAKDTLVAMDGLRLTQANLSKLLSAYHPGDQVQIHLFRDEVLREYTLTLDTVEPTHEIVALSEQSV